jgi:hypothetical protein
VNGRFWDWPERLLAYLDKAQGRRFAWVSDDPDTHDCARFAAGAVLAMTGEQLLPTWGYRTEIGAYRHLKREGGLAAMADARLPRIGIGAARRGDVGLIMQDGRETLTVVLGVDIAGPAERGLAFVPRAELVAAWTV